MPTTIHLVRHGDYGFIDHALGGRAPHALSERGRAQAEALATRFAACALAAVVTSPVRRAVETAAPIAARSGLALERDAAFNEIDFGAWEGARFAALQDDSAWLAWNTFRSVAPAPGEAMLAVQARVSAGLWRWHQRHPDAAIVLVSHADVIKAALCHMLGMPLDLMQRLEIAPASTSEIVLADRDVRVRTINQPP